MRERVNLGKSAPALYQAVVELDRLASEAAAQAGIATINGQFYTVAKAVWQSLNFMVYPCWV